jgi:hypothetical protein
MLVVGLSLSDRAWPAVGAQSCVIASPLEGIGSPSTVSRHCVPPSAVVSFPFGVAVDAQTWKAIQPQCVCQVARYLPSYSGPQIPARSILPAQRWRFRQRIVETRRIMHVAVRSYVRTTWGRGELRRALMAGQPTTLCGYLVIRSKVIIARCVNVSDGITLRHARI